MADDRKTRIKAIVESVEGILGDDIHKKKLKKKKALRRFIRKMEDKRAELAVAAISDAELSPDRRASLERSVRTLTRQIDAADTLLAELEAEP